MIRVCSHVRTGTHLLCSLLFRNLETGARDYEELHYSHTRMPDDLFIHVHRPLLPVAISVWKMREHFGYHRSVSFHDLVTVPLEQLPTVESKFRMRDAVGLLPERWARYTYLFMERASLNIRYSELIDAPQRVVAKVGVLYGLRSVEPFVPVTEKVGWRSSDAESPVLWDEDIEALTALSRRVIGE